MNYNNVQYTRSTYNIDDLPHDAGVEIVFVGRSNVGKSSVLNTLTGFKKLARVSKNPGCTQAINFFKLDDSNRLVDLPGYGYSKVSRKEKKVWSRNITYYLTSRNCLKGIVLLMDSRRQISDDDLSIINLTTLYKLKLYILLTKFDKIDSSNRLSCQQKWERYLKKGINNDLLDFQFFSSLKNSGISKLRDKLSSWYFCS